MLEGQQPWHKAARDFIKRFAPNEWKYIAAYAVEENTIIDTSKLDEQTQVDIVTARLTT